MRGVRALSVVGAGLLLAVALAVVSSSPSSAAGPSILSGRVVDGSGAGIANVNVSAYAGGSAATCCTWITAVSTDSLGAYSISLSPGTYRVQFYPPASSSFVARWWSTAGTARRFESASDVDLTTSQTLSDTALESGATISGTVANGVAGINVSAYVSNGTCCTWVAGTATDSAGSYSFIVPAGTYRLQFYPQTSTSLIAQWWDGTAGGAKTFDGALDIVVASSAVTGKNATLSSGHKIAGRIMSDATTGISGASAQVFVGGTGATCCTWVTGSSTDATGLYTILVPDGTYRLQLVGPQGLTYMGQWYDGGSGVARFEQATDLTVSGTDVTPAVTTLVTGRRISGKITRDATNGISGASVSAFTGGAGATCCTWVAGTGAGSDGRYSFIVPAGTYKLQFQGPQGGTYMSRWWDGGSGVTRFDLAPDVDLTTADATANATLGTGVSLSGRVTDGTNGVGQVGVGAFAGGSSATCCTWVGGTGTDPQGNYNLVLPAGTYRLYYFAPRDTPLVSQWWNGGTGAAHFDGGVDVALATNTTGQNVTLASGARITGTVTDGTTGIAGAFVSAFTGGASSVCCTWIGGTSADDSGHYTLALPTGTYRLMFQGSQTSGYIARWWDGASGVADFSRGHDLALSTAATVNMALTSGNRISGHVTDGTGQGLPFVGVAAFAGGSSATCCSWLAGNGTDQNGNYNLVVPNGTYRIQFFPPRDSTFSSEWWTGTAGGAARFDQAVDITVNNSNATGKDATLTAGLLITGRVTDSTGNGVGNVFVSAFNGGTATCCTWVSGTPTDGAGHYALVVASGTYRLQVSSPPGSAYMSQWWTSTGGANNFSAADDIAVGANVSGKSFSLTSGIRISGRVVDGGGNGIPMVGVGAFLGGGGATCCTWVSGGGTDGTGNYTLVVQPGTYRLQFWPPRGSSFLGVWWKSSGEAQRFDLADDVVASTNVTGIGATLITGSTISGRVTDGTNGIPNAGVSAFLGGAATCCTWITGTGTDAAGNYSISVPAGSYKLQFHAPPGSSFTDAFWKAGVAAGSFSAADTITVGPNATNKDVVLARGIGITGTVTDGSAHPLQGVSVSAMTGCPQQCQFVAGTATGPDGTYRLIVTGGGASYKIQFYPPPGSPFVSQWYSGVTGGASNPSGATAVTVNASDVTGIDASLASGVRITGTVSDGTNGIPNANVSAMTGCSPQCTFVSGTNTSPTGTYSLVVPTGGTYFVQFRPPQGSSFIGQWWNNATGPNTAIPATAVGPLNADRSGIDAVLTTGVRIRGTVTAGGGPLAGVNVSANDCSGGHGCNWVAGDQTLATGAYTLIVPANGSYKVFFMPMNGASGPVYLSQWYSGANDSSSATAVPVVTSDATGIDAALALGVRLRGTVSGGGSGLQGAFVNANTCAGSPPTQPCAFVTGAQTAADGTYTLVVPQNSGPYYLYANPPQNTSWVGKWYKAFTTGALALGGASAVNAATSDVTGLAVTLPRGWAVSGHVTFTGAPAPIHISVWDCTSTCFTFAFANLDGSNNYSVLVPNGTSYRVVFGTEQGGPSPKVWNNRSLTFDQNGALTSGDNIAVSGGAVPNIDAAF